jgi:pyruvate ferredoxin oxidoreductase alpha subunit
VALGSVNGTIKDVIDGMRDDGYPIGALTISSYRPFPLDEVKSALAHAKRVVVVEKCLSVGAGGIVSADVRKALAGTGIVTHTAVAGLGGRPIPSSSLRTLFERASLGALETVHFLDLNWEIVNREIARMKGQRRSGPTAENILRDLGLGAVTV